MASDMVICLTVGKAPPADGGMGEIKNGKKTTRVRTCNDGTQILLQNRPSTVENEGGNGGDKNTIKIRQDRERE